MPTFDSQMLGIGQALRVLQSELLPNDAMKAAKRGLNASLAIIGRGQRAAVPKAMTPGHSNDEVKKSIGKSVKQVGVSRQLIGKSGIGAGKKRGTFNPVGVFIAVGTIDRYAGVRTIRSQVKRRWAILGQESTGKPIAFRGRVRKFPFIQMGFEATRIQARIAFENVVFADLDKSFRASLMSIQ